MCPSNGQCNQFEWQQWEQEPSELGKRAAATGRPWGEWLSVAARFTVEGQWQERPPLLWGSPVRLEDLARFVSQLLSEDPFNTAGASAGFRHSNEVPWIDLNGSGEGKVVAITQRQLAFIVANALMGNKISAQDGLAAALARCSSKLPAPTGYLLSLLSLLAILSQELSSGAQGNVLVAATPGSLGQEWKEKLTTHTLSEPLICAQEAGGPDCGLRDFMAGGTQLQALADSASRVVGGAGELCDVAVGQDESLVQFYSEALAFAFFAGAGGQLPVPFTLLGARRYMKDLSGQTSMGAPNFGLCGSIGWSDWLNEDIPQAVVEVSLDRSLFEKVPSSAFVAIATESSGCTGSKADEAAMNHCVLQRTHLDRDVALWYRAFEPTMYNEWVQQAFRTVVRRIGTGPWGTGVGRGDSQQNFLATWIATSLLSGNVTMDYYVYSNFCDNPGNQCYVLGAKGCEACIANSSGNAHPVPAGRCGQAGVQDMVASFKQRKARTLYDQLAQSMDITGQVFDLVGGFISHPTPPEVLGLLPHRTLALADDAGPIMSALGRCLDAPEPKTGGSTVHMWDCIPGLSSQLWVYEFATEHIRNFDGICLDSSQPNKNGGEVHMWRCDVENPHQRWVLHESGGKIQNKNGVCLQASKGHVNGGGVVMGTCRGTIDSQKWLHEDFASHNKLVRDWQGLCLEAPSVGKEGTGLLMKTCDPAGPGQKWVYDENTGLLSQDGVCLRARDPSRPGSELVLGTCDHADTDQQWHYDAAAGLVKHRHGLCLDVPEDSEGSVPAQMWWCYSPTELPQWLLDDGAGLIRNREGYCLDAPDPDMKGSEVQMRKCDRERASEHWLYEESNGRLKTQFGSCLAAPLSQEKGSTLLIEECDENDDRLGWHYEGQSGKLQHSSGMCLHAGELLRDGGVVNMWPCQDDVTEKWV